MKSDGKRATATGPRQSEVQAGHTMKSDRTEVEEPPRETAYYYGDLERLKQRQWSPEYTTPNTSPRLETYSTAGTFPLPQQKEKEPLLAELEVVGRVPLSELPGARRSRSWFCCPEPAEDLSQTSWRYASLRPVTAPPRQRPPMSDLVSLPCGPPEDPETRALRAERDALARRLASERARASAQQRAQDARLAELHGVIAELVRRRAAERQRQPIPEEDASERSDECESTTQPAADIEDDQNECSSLPSPGDPPSPRLPRLPRPAPHFPQDSEEQSSACDSRSSRDGGRSPTSGGSERLSAARWCSARQAKVASRVRLRRSGDPPTDSATDDDEGRCAEAAARLALDAGDAEDLQGALLDCAALRAALMAADARGDRLETDAALLRAALARATDTAHRMGQACAAHEAGAVSLCAALRAADRALEAYDVLLALAETSPCTAQRAAAERVARQLLARLADERAGARLGEPLLPPGPWLLHDSSAEEGEAWSEEAEQELRSQAARLKRETAELRAHHPPPKMFTYHEGEEELAGTPPGAGSNMVDMEAAVAAQELASAREERCEALAALAAERARSHQLVRALRDRDHQIRHATPWVERAAETQL